jgi:sulfatase modifying factor 1
MLVMACSKGPPCDCSCDCSCACDTSPTGQDTGVEVHDADGDGHDSVLFGGDDCLDQDPTAYPGAVHSDQGLDLVVLCDGTFLMGSPESEVGRDEGLPPPEDRETQRQVTLTHPFLIGVTPVTQSQFLAFMGYDPSRDTGCGSDCPVENLSWHEAAALANAVSEAAGLAPCFACTGSGITVSCSLDQAWDTPYACPGYRLPTSAEFEYAARGGHTSAFGNGLGIKPGHEARCEGGEQFDDGSPMADAFWYCGNATSKRPVAGFAPNDWGIHDMHGNIYGWCHDLYEGAGDEPQQDHFGPLESELGRVTRGGSWFVDPSMLRSAYRSFTQADNTIDDLGVRLVRSL